MARILLLNGPNLNLLGRREPDLYGRESLEEIVGGLSDRAQSAGHELEHLQSNAEHELVERVQETRAAWIILNPAAFTHSSIALRDALAATGTPFIEVHLSNIHAREPFRRNSYFSDLAAGVICGLGATGYRIALDAIVGHLGGDN